MKRYFLSAAIVALLVLLAGCFEVATFNLVVTGFVRDGFDLEALGGVSVNATVQGKPGSWSDVTDPSGGYSLYFTGLAPVAVINVQFSLSGYVTDTQSFARSTGGTYVLDVYLERGQAGDTIGGFASLMNLEPPSSSIPAAASGLKAQKVPSIPEASEVIISPKPGTSYAKMQSSIAAKGTRIRKTEFEMGYVVVPVPAGKDMDDFISKLEAEGWAEYVEPNSWAAASSFIPNDDYFEGYQWNMYATTMPHVWPMDDFGPPMVIAVLDTGVDVTHPDLAGRTLDSIDTYYLPFEYGYNLDLWGHGTNVAGIIAAAVQNGQYMAGMSNRGAMILPVKVLNNNGGGNADTIAAGIRAAADSPYSVDIINMSLGFGTDLSNATVEAQLQYAQGKGITIVAAAGNDSRPRADFPSNQPGVIAVSSVNPNLVSSDFTNYGVEVDFAAPGGEKTPFTGVWSLYPVAGGGAKKGTYVTDMAGTSQSSPHVAALIAMMMQNGFTSSQAIEMIADTAQYNDRSPLYYGNGIINAHAALNSLTLDKALFWLADLAGVPVPGLSGYGSIDRSFEFSSQPGNYYLRGWMDTDADGSVGYDDYYSSEPVSVASGGIFLDHVFELGIVTDISPSALGAAGVIVPAIPEARK